METAVHRLVVVKKYWSRQTCHDISSEDDAPELKSLATAPGEHSIESPPNLVHARNFHASYTVHSCPTHISIQYS